MTLDRFILKTQFSFEKMLGMAPEEARRYYLTEFFVPVGYEMLSSQTEDTFVLLLLSGNGGVWAPVFQLVQGHVDRTQAPNFIIGPGRPLPDQACVKHFERITDGVLDVAAQGRALKHAFGQTSMQRESGQSEYMPHVATMQIECVEEERHISVNVLVQLRGRAPPGFLNISAHSRTAALRSNVGYGNRSYNILTGAWVALCDPASPTCCAECLAIYNSPHADSAYT